MHLRSEMELSSKLMLKSKLHIQREGSMTKGVLTFNGIIECWKKGKFPEDFEDRLEHHLQIKSKSFENIRIKDVVDFLSQVAIAIEIGLQLNYDRFVKYKEHWMFLLQREWKVDLEEVVVRWREMK